MKIMFLISLVLFASSSIFATDLVNSDDKTHYYDVWDGNTKYPNQKISARTSLSNVCSSTANKCIVIVKGIGQITTGGNETVTIKNGTLSDSTGQTVGKSKPSTTKPVYNTPKKTGNDTPTLIYNVDQKVSILWNNKWYKGKILKKIGNKYFITYDGYEASWNEWVGPERLKPLK
ncbi:MAG: hypothetical protein OEZ34_09745 [Spirochaetia bacterium]|nr:hypothetical protein [Spirochaetia bacterium]